MHILINDDWENGFLDYAIGDDQCRIKVCLWEVLAPISDAYFSPSRNWRIVANYVREIGFRQVIRKIWSRLGETKRNQKFLSCGAGVVVDSRSAQYRPGDAVVFIAPFHPKCVERIVLPKELLAATDSSAFVEDKIYFKQRTDDVENELGVLAGWAPEAGISLAGFQIQRALLIVAERVAATDWHLHLQLTLRPSTPVTERVDTNRPSEIGLKAVLFGYGHYAKTNIIPNLQGSIRLAGIHEIDPCQIGKATNSRDYYVDSCPRIRDVEDFDICLIASHHHTHASLSADALRRGACVVSEKPIATTTEDLDRLLDALSNSTGKYFCGFHKRYSPLNDYAQRDLCRGKEPISYYCIVHEAKLPALHWYRWPNSRSRLVSNGCHWIDHFLFLNDFSDVVASNVWQSTTGDCTVALQLANGASFSMVLTDLGSSRLGVEDHVELRANDVTVRIRNNSEYVAENSQKILRRLSVNRASSYLRMYREIFRRIQEGTVGDTLRMVDVSGRIVLELEEALARKTILETPR